MPNLDAIIGSWPRSLNRRIAGSTLWMVDVIRSKPPSIRVENLWTTGKICQATVNTQVENANDDDGGGGDPHAVSNQAGLGCPAATGPQGHGSCARGCRRPARRHPLGGQPMGDR